MNATEQIVWDGPEELRQFLVPIESLEPFPGNPRLGDPRVVAGSLRRFGQKKPIVIDGRRIVAGHHVVRGAADELGWTHVAALQGEFPNEDEQRAFLLADNRASDVGTYDSELLVAHLSELAEMDALEGTGYTGDDLDSLLADLHRLQNLDPPELPPMDDPLPPDPSGDVLEVVLMYSKAQRDELEQWLKIIAKEKKTNGVSETVFEGLRAAALKINQG